MISNLCVGLKSPLPRFFRSLWSCGTRKSLINGAICFEHIKRDRENAYAKASKVIKSFERHKHLSVEGIEYFELFKEACFEVEHLKKRFL